MHIAHHPYDKKQIEGYYETQLKSIETSKTVFNKGKYFVLRDMYTETLAVACCSVILGKSKEEIRNYFYLFLDVVTGAYTMGTNIGREISFSFLGKTYTYTPEQKNYMLTDQGWITAFFAALLFLDIEKISELNKIDLEKVKAVTNVKGGEHTFAFAKFLQHVFTGDQNNFENLKKASDLIKPELLPAEIYDFALQITGGQIDLFGAALLKETPYFNEVFLKVVEWHKTFYAKHNPQSPEGLFAVELTAITVLAKQYKIALEHTSDYTPAIFIDGF